MASISVKLWIVCLPLFLVIGTAPGAIFCAEKGPVLHYDFSEGQGTVLRDRSGHNNDGMISGAEWAKDARGSFLVFDGTNNYVEVKNSPALQLEEEFTIEVTVKPGENPKKEGLGTHRLLIGKRGEFWDKDSSFALYADEGGNSFSAYIRYGSKVETKENEIYLVSTPVSQTGAWQKVVMVRKKGELKLFVDSAPPVLRITPAPTVSSNQPLRIGGLPGRFFQGAIREIKMFNYAKEQTDAPSKPVAKTKKPYLVMVTSLDEQISSTALLDVPKETVKLLNGSPFEGIAYSLLDVYSAQPLPDEALVMEKARELKNVSTKDIWARVNLNRIYQRVKTHPEYQDGWTERDVAQLPVRGASVDSVRKKSTPSFARIKGVDVFDEAKALSEFYRMWRLALKFGRVMHSGIVLDLEDYGSDGKYLVTNIARSQGKSTEEVIARLRDIGARMTDIAAEEYPDITVISFFTFLDRPNYDGNNHFAFPAYVAQGMLMRAKEKSVGLRLVEGGETEINYVNRTLDGLKSKITNRNALYSPWIARFPKNFALGGTITLWDDPSKLTAWTREDAGEPNPFRSLNDFKPFLKELFAAYDYIWVYQPMCIDYKPYDPTIAPAFHAKLQNVFSDVLREMRGAR